MNAIAALHLYRPGHVGHLRCACRVDPRCCLDTAREIHGLVDGPVVMVLTVFERVLDADMPSTECAVWRFATVEG